MSGFWAVGDRSPNPGPPWYPAGSPKPLGDLLENSQGIAQGEQGGSPGLGVSPRGCLVLAQEEIVRES